MSKKISSSLAVLAFSLMLGGIATTRRDDRMKQSWIPSGRLCVLLALLLTWTANATTWYVEPNYGTDASGHGVEPDDPFDTLQYAIGASSWGDTIRLLADVDLDELTVGTGTRFITIEGYDGGSPEPIDFDGYNQLIHAGTSGLVLRRINFGSTSTEGDGGCVYSDGPLTLEDCTFEYSDATGFGGAVYASRVSAYNCVFDTCESERSGGAIYSFGNVVLSNCTFTSNSADDLGGAVYSRGGSIEIEDCIFYENESYYGGDGGAVYCGQIMFGSAKILRSSFERNDGDSSLYVSAGNSDLTISRCSFIDEYSDAAVKIVPSSALRTLIENLYVDDANTALHFIYPTAFATEHVIVRHCTIIDATTGIQIDGRAPDSGEFDVMNSIIWDWDTSESLSGNISTVNAQYSLIKDLDSLTLASTSGSFDEYPNLDASGHLQSDSPCVDAGDVPDSPFLLTVDREGSSRLQGRGYDIGAFESAFYAELSCSEDAISRSCSVGGSASDSFFLENEGGGWMDYIVTANQSWIQISPSAGTIEGQGSDIIDIDLDASGLGVGVHTGSITVSGGRNGNTASGSPVTIPVTLTVEDTPTVATPTISPNGGTYQNSVQVRLSCGTSGATIRYTTNGATPTSGSPQYTAPFTLTSSAKVKAKAFKSGYNDSGTASADFTVNEEVPFTYTTNNGKITITGYTGDGGAVTIPSTINGFPVTSIGILAFSYCDVLTSVTIPDSVTTIEDGAFAWCTALTSVNIGNSVTYISDLGPFYYCPALISITVDPTSSTYSSLDGVLFNKSQTTLIQYPGGKSGDYTIPDSVTTIYPHAFAACTALTSITVDPANSTYSSLDGVLFNKSQTTLIQYPGGKSGDYTIPDSVFSIGILAFSYCDVLTSVTIPDSVTTIDGGAFEVCTALTSVTIPDSVTSIGRSAFADCDALTSVIIGNSVTIIGSYAFSDCSSLTSVTIGNSVTSIGDSAFEYCEVLTSIYFRGNAPTFGDYVFSKIVTFYRLADATGWPPVPDSWYGCPTALWIPEQYTVSYNANEETSGTAPEPQTKMHDVTLILASNIGNLAKTGNTFAGWNTASDGTGKDYAEGANYTANAFVTLYAKWLPSKNDTPSYITASDGTRSDGVALSWPTVSGATHYKIYRSTSADGTKVYSSWFAGTLLLDTTATPGVTYYYWVTAARSSTGEGESDFSPPDTGWRSQGNVATPSWISASDGTRSDGVALSWASVSGATHYMLARSTSSTGAGAVFSSWYAGTSLLDTTASPGVTYYYWVKAAHSNTGDGESDFSTANSGWRSQGNVAAPSWINASDGTRTDGVALSWPTVNGATHYKIYRSNSADGTKVYSSWFAGTSLLDTSAQPGVTYYYWVKAARSNTGEGESDFSSYNTGYRRSEGTLAAPAYINASDGTRTDGVALSWASVSGATHYKIARATSSSGAGVVYSDWYAGTSLLDTSASVGVTYYYWVKAALSSTGEGGSSFSPYNVGYVSPSFIPMVVIPGGTNSGTDPDFGAYSLTVSTFYMDATEVTNDEMVRVMTWAKNHGRISVSSSSVQNLQGDQQELLDLDFYACRITWSGTSFGIKLSKGSGYPCLEVTWYGAAAYCNYRSEMEGKTPCYNLSDWSCDFSANGYRLPTKNEWEYAARGGVESKRFPWGDTITHSRANYKSDSSYSYDVSPTRGYHPDFDVGENPYTSPVGYFPPNGYGLYDMVGNVSEWCNTLSHSYRCLRNGGWYSDASSLRCRTPSWSLPYSSGDALGFRAVCR